jgi:aspartate racemase
MIKLKSVGILGGMGPACSGHFFDVLVRKLNESGVQQDSDFPEIIHYSVPLPDWNETGFAIKSKKGNERIIKALQDYVLKLTQMGVEMIAIPCNTIHFMYEEMKSGTSVPILNLLEETGQYAKNHGFNKIAVFGSRSTRDLGLYDFLNPIKANDDEQVLIDNLIESVMFGKQTPEDKYLFKKLIEYRFSNGADAVVLGCTELPLLIEQKDTHVPLINTTEILAIKFSKEIIG